MSAHTPGPWVPVEQGDANEFCIISKAGQWVIGFHQNGEMLPREQLANAHLIAAAPELLEALCKLANLYDAMGAPRGPCRIIADAAISKATGGTP